MTKEVRRKVFLDLRTKELWFREVFNLNYWVQKHVVLIAQLLTFKVSGI